MWLVAGLGNPGERYARTRHNIGFRVVDELAQRSAASAWRTKFCGQFAEFERTGVRVALLKPQLFMNRSGQSVAAALAFFKLGRENLLVVHDELDLEFGTLRLKLGGGEAGHNGLRSVTEHVGGRDYVRLRWGIGRSAASFGGDTADYVLQAFAAAERDRLDSLTESAADAVALVIDQGLQEAMKVVNRRVII